MIYLLKMASKIRKFDPCLNNVKTGRYYIKKYMNLPSHTFEFVYLANPNKIKCHACKTSAIEA